MPALAPRLDLFKPPASATATQKARTMRATGIDVIALSSGEPDFPTTARRVLPLCRLRRADRSATAGRARAWVAESG